MPVKRRASKRKTHTVTAEAWDLIFECGRDYFADLAAIGLVQPHRLPESADRAAAQAAWDAALRDAWARHGPAFMATWVPQPGRATPWAFETFGAPEEMEADPCR